MGGEAVLTLGPLSIDEPIVILGRRRFSPAESVNAEADEVFEPVSVGNHGKKISSPIYNDPDDHSYLIDQLSDGKIKL